MLIFIICYYYGLILKVIFKNLFLFYLKILEIDNILDLGILGNKNFLVNSWGLVLVKVYVLCIWVFIVIIFVLYILVVILGYKLILIIKVKK